MGMELLFLLLPVAALSGWIVGRRRRHSGSKRGTECPPLSRDYFQGLNYLLNEQPEEALEVFIRMSEADSDAIDIQFALASLFLRRGEVDRAIRIHQNLIARPMLSREQRNHALYELGRDYMRAGLFDRAESLFHELSDDSGYSADASRQLLDIYQQEKEWQNAIAVARKLNGRRDKTHSAVIAHFLCELAEEAVARGELSEAVKLTKRAFTEDGGSVRASLLEAQLHERQGKFKQAIRSYKRVEQQDAAFLPLIIEPMKLCYQHTGDMEEFQQYLAYLCDKQESISLVLAHVSQLREQGQEQKAMEILQSYLKRRPSLRALDAMLELGQAHTASGSSLDIDTLRQVVHKSLELKPVCQCSNCGFTSRTLHWQCPSCKQWGKIKPIQGVEGE